MDQLSTHAQGRGGWLEKQGGETELIPFPRSAVQKLLGRDGFDELVLIRCTGNCMYPVIKDGDFVIVDRDYTIVDSESPYVAVLGDMLMVKYVYKTGPNTYLLKANDIQINVTPDSGYFEIIGKVCGIIRSFEGEHSTNDNVVIPFVTSYKEMIDKWL